MATRARSGARTVSTSGRAAMVSGPRAPYRVLMYSHDSFGLGQLRRCHAIAHALVARHQDLNVLILTGSPIIGRFRFRARVDFVRLPGVVKLRSGACASLSLEMDIADTLALRASIIEHTARVFRPHLFVVDETPLGLLGEAQGTLRLLKRRGCRLVLGLHDVMDGSTMLTEEERPKRILPGLDRLYKHVWMYGLPEVYDSGRGQGPPSRGRPRMVFTGYLGREPQPDVALPYEVTALAQRGPFLLVTPGGGSDGAELIHTVLTAHERFDAQLPWPSLIVYGPFLSARHRTAFEQRAARLDRVTTLVFHEHLENLMEKAAAVVCSGGYNTFCEALSLGKRCLIVPRETPRGGQLLRAEAARKLGLVHVLHPDQLSPETLAEALTQLRVQSPPAMDRIPGLLGGLPQISAIVGQWRSDGRLTSGGR
jgi:predicted glycosyltransferase